MKKIFLIISVTLFFYNSVFADWEKLGEVERGGEYFVEKDTIIKESGYIYFWKMVDYTKPFLDSNFYSAKVYIKGDCKVKKIKTLTYVFYTGKKGTGEKIKAGMIFTIEPMINLGKYETKTLKDGWTAVTKDKSLSAQFEHTVGVTKEGCEIFTLSKS